MSVALTERATLTTLRSFQHLSEGKNEQLASCYLILNFCKVLCPLLQLNNFYSILKL